MSPCKQIINAVHILLNVCFLERQENYLISLYLLQSKNIKMQLQEIPHIDHNVLELFCILLYTDYLSDFQKKKVIASPHDTNLKYQILAF